MTLCIPCSAFKFLCSHCLLSSLWTEDSVSSFLMGDTGASITVFKKGLLHNRTHWSFKQRLAGLRCC